MPKPPNFIPPAGTPPKRTPVTPTVLPSPLAKPAAAKVLPLTARLRREPPPRPVHVPRAVFILWVWIFWAVVYGIFETWHNIPVIMNTLNAELPGVINISAEDMLRYAIGAYILVGLTMAWTVVNIGAGKHWARNSFLWSFIFQGIVTLAPPYHPILEYFGDIPDLGLQLYAATLLYSEKSGRWFAWKNSIDVDD